MGVDINLYVESNITQAELDKKNAVFVAAVPGAWAGIDKDRPALTLDKYHKGRVDVNIAPRYYSDGYERGHWPTIATAIEVLRYLFEDHDVYYGPDYDDDGELVTDEFIADMWRHYTGPEGDAYRARGAQRWQEAKARQAAEMTLTNEQAAAYRSALDAAMARAAANTFGNFTAIGWFGALGGEILRPDLVSTDPCRECEENGPDWEDNE